MENKPKQTAVEWLVCELNQEFNYIPMTQWDRIREIVQQAKAMEKDEILIAYDNGWEAVSYNPQQYYNEEYAKDTNN